MSQPPVVVKQLWIVRVGDAKRTCYNAGSSYHLTEADRVAMINEVASRLSTDMEGEREEPIGDPAEISVSLPLYEQIKNTPHGLRLR